MIIQPEALVVELALPDHEPIVCIPHGICGLHRAGDFATFAHRVEHANDPSAPVPGPYRDGEALIYLAHHARGCIPAQVSLVGAAVRPASPAQVERFGELSWLHRASADKDRSAHNGMLTLADALKLVADLEAK